MKQLAKIIGAAAYLSAVLYLGTVNVYAEGLSVQADKESCETGDTVTVTIDTTGIGGETPADVQVEFNSNRLGFVNCSAEYGGGGGGLVTFKDKTATVEFTTLSGGDAEIAVTATAEDSPEPETASVIVSVAGEDTAAALDSFAGSDLGVSPGTIEIQDGRVIQTVFAEEFMPILFHKEAADYNGQSTECAKFDMGDITLLYTTDESGADGKFMIYDSAAGSLDDFRMIQGIENRFIIVLADCEGEIPDGYTKAVLDWNGQTLTAFMETDVAEGTAAIAGNVDPADFFLVYAVSSEGNKGWYRYDKNEGTYQRYIVSDTAGNTVDEDTNEAEADDTEGILDDYVPHNIQSIIALVCAALSLILLITVIILAVRVHDYADELDAIYEGDYYGDEEEDDEDEDDGEEDDVRYRSGQSRGAVTAASLVGRSLSEVEEEDEDDEGTGEAEEDDEDDDDAPEEEYLTRRERKELERERKEQEREEKWRLREEKKAARNRARGYEEATPIDWENFEAERNRDDEERSASKKDDLPPRKRIERDDDQEKPHVAREEEMRERQKRLFEQQQRIEEQRRIEDEQLEAERQKQQQQFIDSRTEEPDLDEDFQFEFLNLD